MPRHAITLFTLALTLTGAAHAATRAEQTAACRGDAIRFCAFSIPNEAKITACMKKNLDRLSPQCRAMFNPLPIEKKPAKKPATTPHG